MITPLPSWNSEQTWATFQDGGYCRYFEGLELQKSAEDLDRYREAVAHSKVECIIEAGTRTGASALWFHLELGLEVMSIDVAPQFTPAVGPPHTGPGIVWVRGGSTDDAVVRNAHGFAAGRKTMVSLDSDHHAPHVLNEILLYGDLVSPGCHLVVEDGCFETWGQTRARRGGSQIPEIGGPLRAVNDSYLPDNPVWERAVNIERLWPISHSPGGWWKRLV